MITFIAQGYELYSQWTNSFPKSLTFWWPGKYWTTLTSSTLQITGITLDSIVSRRAKNVGLKRIFEFLLLSGVLG
jgi:hypothetical protein